MERKEYEVKGTVTISTEEYRDLIMEACEEHTSASDYRTKYWSEQDKTKQLEEKVKAQELAIAHYRDFVDLDERRRHDYIIWLADLKAKEVEV